MATCLSLKLPRQRATASPPRKGELEVGVALADLRLGMIAHSGDSALPAVACPGVVDGPLFLDPIVANADPVVVFPIVAEGGVRRRDGRRAMGYA